jgi:ParB-like chromosome segregation protein Spo0J
MNNENIDHIIVFRHPEKDLYAVLDGHHRYYAYAELGKKQIKCALAGGFSSVIFYLTENGYLQPASQFTKEIRQPAKRFHKNLKEFLDKISNKFT